MEQFANKSYKISEKNVLSGVFSGGGGLARGFFVRGFMSGGFCLGGGFVLIPHIHCINISQKKYFEIVMWQMEILIKA